MLVAASAVLGSVGGMERFLGDSIAASVAGATFVGQATFNGCIAVTTWPRRDVMALLSDGLTLAEHAAGDDGHPVVFVFGEQTGGAVRVGGYPFPVGQDYREVCVAVPFVRHVHGRHLHTFIPRMYATYLPAVSNGNTHYGFSKRMASISWEGAFYLATSLTGALLLHIETEAVKSAAAPASLAAVRAMFALPMLGRRADGRYVTSYFDWDFDTATVGTADVAVSIADGGLDAVAARRCPDLPSGSVAVRGMVWRLSWPMPCRF